MSEREVQLIRAAKRGEGDAFSALVQSYKDRVFQTAYGILRHRLDAEDVAQEVFVKAFFSLPKLREEQAFGAWIVTITTRVALDILARRKRLESVWHDITQMLDRNSRGPDPVHTRLVITEILDALSPEHRAALILREVQGFSYQEIADILDIPIGTVRSRLSTARAQMHRLLFADEDLKGAGDP